MMDNPGTCRIGGGLHVGGRAWRSILSSSSARAEPLRMKELRVRCHLASPGAAARRWSARSAG